MRISLVVMLAALMCAGYVKAQERAGLDPSQVVDRMFESDDANKDGKLDKDEASERIQASFTEADTDEDGFLSKEEVTAMLKERMGRRPERRARGGDGAGGAGGRGGDGGGLGGGRGGQGGRGFGGQGGAGGAGGGPARLLQMMPIIQVLDVDKNGEISAEEIEGAVAALKTLDKNQDGKISADEMMPEMGQGFGGGRGGRGGRGGGPGGANGGDGGDGGGAIPQHHRAKTKAAKATTNYAFKNPGRRITFLRPFFLKGTPIQFDGAAGRNRLTSIVFLRIQIPGLVSLRLF